MFWWGLAIILLIAGGWIAFREKEAFCFHLGLVVSLLILAIGLFTSFLIINANNPEGMTITETDEIKLYSIELYEPKSTPDEAYYLGTTKKSYWYEKEDITNSNGKILTHISQNHVNIYDTEKENPRLEILTYTKKTTATRLFSFITPSYIEYNFYIPENSIKYGLAISE